MGHSCERIKANEIQSQPRPEPSS